MKPSTRESRLTAPTSRSLVELDVVACLTAWLILLYGISAGMVLPGFGAIGQPATLVALGAFAWWLSASTIPTLGLDKGPHPLRYLLFLYIGYVAASYALASTHALSSTQQSGSSRELITQFTLFGITAITLDGIVEIHRLRTLLRRLCTIGGLFAGLGIVQSAVGESLLFLPPGLEWNSGVIFDIEFRQGTTRPLSTGLHPIEYAAIVACLVPIAVHFVLYPKDMADRVRAIAELSALIVAVPISLSRTALVCLAVSLIVLAFGWTWRRRFNTFALGVLSIPIVAAVVPRAYAIMVDLFISADSSLSIQSRLNRIPNVMALLDERPWFGLGLGVFNSTDYFLVDNQIWGLALSTGLVGLALTLALLVTAALMGAWIRYRPQAGEELGHMGRAVAASITGLTVSMATFDAFFYRILTFTLFLLVGCAGALWRLTGNGEAVRDRWLINPGESSPQSAGPGDRTDGAI